ncbi:hypothetical protein DSO57_1026261 [Entomophthora muscae]|uniref:Uncharacterized protein n=1 Tax=Entomophthora muscae TaxID=34485 RepID=A0ACC2S3R0_9FUNG|nr:hypothetical protein DSO57_1026261 [Entomophthora muscae]
MTLYFKQATLKIKNTHKLLVDTGSNHTKVDLTFADAQQLDQVPRRFKAVQVADSQRMAITHETVPFSVRMGNIQVKLSGPIMAGLRHNVIAGLDWLCYNQPYIDWDTSVITLNRNGVGFQIYPVEMSKLLHNTVFVRITLTGTYNFKGETELLTDLGNSCLLLHYPGLTLLQFDRESFM